MINNALEALEAPQALDALDALDAFAMLPSPSTATSTSTTTSSSVSRPGSAYKQRASVSTISSAGTHLLTPRVESTLLPELPFQRTSLDAWACEEAPEEKLSKWFGHSDDNFDYDVIPDDSPTLPATLLEEFPLVPLHLTKPLIPLSSIPKHPRPTCPPARPSTSASQVPPNPNRNPNPNSSALRTSSTLSARPTRRSSLPQRQNLRPTPLDRTLTLTLESITELPRDLDSVPDGSWALRPPRRVIGRSTSHPNLGGVVRMATRLRRISSTLGLGSVSASVSGSASVVSSAVVPRVSPSTVTSPTYSFGPNAPPIEASALPPRSASLDRPPVLELLHLRLSTGDVEPSRPESTLLEADGWAWPSPPSDRPSLSMARTSTCTSSASVPIITPRSSSESSSEGGSNLVSISSRSEQPPVFITEDDSPSLPTEDDSPSLPTPSLLFPVPATHKILSPIPSVALSKASARSRRRAARKRQAADIADEVFAQEDEEEEALRIAEEQAAARDRLEREEREKLWAETQAKRVAELRETIRVKMDVPKGRQGLKL
ncbi:hypothetical protein JCM24511_05124 [Saitozyma sp. JCM 24511]|nr:hypothetical protein JCM24511_05124 [Saitozyma sp. JCM 24511]